MSSGSAATFIGVNFTLMLLLTTAFTNGPDQERQWPVGSIVAFAGATPPPGWLVADGRALAARDYPELYQALGTGHGAGFNEQGTKIGDFNLPDARGRFLRGVDLSESGEASGTDPDAVNRMAARSGGNAGNAIGSVQSDTTRSHTHTISPNPHSHGLAHRIIGDTKGGFNAIQTNGGQGTGSIWDIGIKATRDTALTIAAVGGLETRPTNIAVYWIIRVN